MEKKFDGRKAFMLFEGKKIEMPDRMQETFTRSIDEIEIAKFRGAIAALTMDGPGIGVDISVHAAMIEGLKSKAEDLRRLIKGESTELSTEFNPKYDEVFFDVEVQGELHECINEEWAVAKLLIDDVLFVSSVKTQEGVVLTLYVSCNDVFARACAGTETVAFNELGDLYKDHITDTKWGSTKWVVRKRSARPQLPVEVSMKKDGAWEDWMDSLSNIDDNNG